jgi:hypothetical protein
MQRWLTVAEAAPSPSRQAGQDAARRILGGTGMGLLKIAVGVVIVVFIWYFLKSRAGR